MYINKRFWKENGMPIFWSVVVLLGIIVLLWFLYSRKAVALTDFKRLVSEGIKIEGTIESCKPSEGSMSFGKSGNARVVAPGIEVVITYVVGDSQEQTLSEKWPLKYEEFCVVGENVELYYYAQNKRIPVASKYNSSMSALLFVEEKKDSKEIS